MKKFLFPLFNIFILLAFPLQAIEIDMSLSNDISKEISNELALPTILGPDDRKEITGIGIGPGRAVVVIGSESGNCSGAMVASNIVITAAHCLVDEKGNYEKEISVYAVGLPQTLIHRCPYTKAKELWVPDQFIKTTIDNTNPKHTTKKRGFYDYGFIILDNDLGNRTSWLKLKVPSDEDLNKANITVIGHGGDKDFLTLWKSPGQIGKATKYYVHHNADSVEGNSGGPIFKDDDPKNIIALDNFEFDHFNFIRHYPNVGLRIRQEMIDTLNGLQ